MRKLKNHFLRKFPYVSLYNLHIFLHVFYDAFDYHPFLHDVFYDIMDDLTSLYTDILLIPVQAMHIKVQLQLGFTGCCFEV